MSELPDGLVGTGVFATEEEQAKSQELQREAARTPVILLGGTYDMAGRARDRMYKVVHGFALAHGLPEIPGYYGMALDGEFISQDFGK